MIFFFIGGIEQHVSRVLKERAGRCIRCGGPANLVECEKVLKLFFIPVWRWPVRDPAFYCLDCSFIFPRSFPINGDASDEEMAARNRRSVPSLTRDLRCHSCARPVDSQFRFCPFCGFPL